MDGINYAPPDPLAAFLPPLPETFDPAVLESAADYLTIFRHSTAPMTKRHWLDEAGVMQQATYGNGKYFSARVVRVASLEEAVAVINGLEPNECLVNGRLIAGTNMERCRRLSNDRSAKEDDGQPTLEEASHRLWFFDFDGLEADDTNIGGGPFDSLAEPERGVRYLRSRLPDYFARATCWWQFSSSAGAMGNDGSTIRMKLLFWGDRPVSLSQQKNAVRAYPVDPAMWKPAQPIYLAQPIFEGGAVDPLQGRRSGFAVGVEGVARIPEFPDYEDVAKETKEKRERQERGEERGHSKEETRQLLTWLPPHKGREYWSQVGYALGGMVLTDGGVEEDQRRLFHLYMDGTLYRGVFQEPLDAQYRSREEQDRVFDWGLSAGGYGYGTLVHLAREAGGPLKPAAEYLQGIPAGETAKARRKRFNLLGMRELYHQADPPWLIKGLIPEGDTLLIGPPKSGKTLAAIEIACAVVLGRPVLGRFPAVRRGHVIYLTAEGFLGFPRRLRSWGQHYGISEDEMLAAGFWFNRGVPLATNAIDEALALIEEAQSKMGGAAALVVVDTMARSMSGLDENSARDAGLYLQMTEAIREGLNCSTLTLAHTAKLDTNVTTSRGSSAIPAGMDAIIGTKMGAKGTRTVTLKAEDMKDHTPFKPLLLRQKPIAFEGGEDGMVLEFSKVLRDEEEDQESTLVVDECHGLKRAVIDVLREQGAVDDASALTPRELAEGVAKVWQTAGSVQQRETEVLKIIDRLRKGRRELRGGKPGPLRAYCQEIAVPKDPAAPRGVWTTDSKLIGAGSCRKDR